MRDGRCCRGRANPLRHVEVVLGPGASRLFLLQEQLHRLTRRNRCLEGRDELLHHVFERRPLRPPGIYLFVVVALRSTGQKMAKETDLHIFRPHETARRLSEAHIAHEGASIVKTLPSSL